MLSVYVITVPIVILPFTIKKKHFEIAEDFSTDANSLGLHK